MGKGLWKDMAVLDEETNGRIEEVGEVGMKKDFIVRRSITMVEGKPHVETYSEQELIRCKECKYRGDYVCPFTLEDDDGEITDLAMDEWFCSNGIRKE